SKRSTSVSAGDLPGSSVGSAASRYFSTGTACMRARMPPSWPVITCRASAYSSSRSNLRAIVSPSTRSMRKPGGAQGFIAHDVYFCDGHALLVRRLQQLELGLAGHLSRLRARVHAQHERELLACPIGTLDDGIEGPRLADAPPVRRRRPSMRTERASWARCRKVARRPERPSLRRGVVSPLMLRDPQHEWKGTVVASVARCVRLGRDTPRSPARCGRGSGTRSCLRRCAWSCWRG